MGPVLRWAAGLAPRLRLTESLTMSAMAVDLEARYCIGGYAGNSDERQRCRGEC